MVVMRVAFDSNCILGTVQPVRCFLTSKINKNICRHIKRHLHSHLNGFGGWYSHLTNANFDQLDHFTTDSMSIGSNCVFKLRLLVYNCDRWIVLLHIPCLHTVTLSSSRIVNLLTMMMYYLPLYNILTMYCWSYIRCCCQLILMCTESRQ